MLSDSDWWVPHLLPLPPAEVDIEALLEQLRLLGGVVLRLVETVPIDPKLGYGRLVLSRGERAEIALVVLNPGQRIRPHDHGFYNDERVVGAVLVIEGSEFNRFYSFDADSIMKETGERAVPAGEHVVLRSSTIHSVENLGPGRAVSLHAYVHAQGDPRTGKRRF